MRKLSDTLARLKRLSAMPAVAQSGPSRLRALKNFGTNPGDLDALFHVPATLCPGAPLVVVLHGCTQNAADYDAAAGWSRLADEQGFAVLYPQQRRSNNPNLCFNWYASDDVTRGAGEALSIREMIRAIVDKYGIDPARIFVTGLSAGGAMAAAMLATYPDLFAGGAVIAGLPFGVASTLPQAFDRMRGQGGPRAADLADLVRAASNHDGAWPTLSVWHGDADSIVDPSNAAALVEQWRALHGAGAAPDRSERVAGTLRREWLNGEGKVVVEEYRLAGFGHGTPLDTQSSPHGESAAPHMMDAGISSTRRIAMFWGIVRAPVASRQPIRIVEPVAAREAHTDRAEPSGTAAAAQIRTTIEDALRTAGLMR